MKRVPRVVAVVQRFGLLRWRPSLHHKVVSVPPASLTANWTCRRFFSSEFDDYESGTYDSNDGDFQDADWGMDSPIESQNEPDSLSCETQIDPEPDSIKSDLVAAERELDSIPQMAGCESDSTDNPNSSTEMGSLNVTNGEDDQSSSTRIEATTTEELPQCMSDLSIDLQTAVTRFVVDNCKMGPNGEEIAERFVTCQTSDEVRQCLDKYVYCHPLFNDLLNGHGLRVFVQLRLTQRCSALGEVDVWWEFMQKVRHLGFTLTRSNVAIALDTIKKVAFLRFCDEGRNVDIAESSVRRARQIQQWASEDGVPFDWVLHTRCIFIATSLVAIFDRQNLFRTSWPDNDLPRREGIVPEWMVGPDRPRDTDYVVNLMDRYINEVIRAARSDIQARPTLSFMLRLADYYFATDNLTGMLAVMEDCREMGIPVAESTTAKLLQLASSVNSSDTPRLMSEWRAGQPQCLLATPDVSRMLFYFGRSGGGLPCPECGEKYNHRNPSLEAESALTEAQRACSMFFRARVRKGELEDDSRAPQNKDWSGIAFRTLDFCRGRGLMWGATEWRAFIICCIHAPTDKALAAARELEDNLPRRKWDDFLSCQYLRLLRHHAPSRIQPTHAAWLASGCRRSALALVEAVMGVLHVDDDAERLNALQYFHEEMMKAGVYSLQYTKDKINLHLSRLESRGGKVSNSERNILNAISNLSPRELTFATKRYSAADLVPFTLKRSAIHNRWRNTSRQIQALDA